MKKSLPREFYIPKEYTRYVPEIGDYPEDLFACYVDRINLRAIFFIKKQSKPAWHFSFRNSDDMAKKIADSISSLMSWEDKKVERKTKRTQTSSLKVGDILYTSWGYDQTNIDFYQVTALVGAHTVKVRPIGSKIDHSDTYSDYMVADKDRFVGDEKTYRVKYGNRIKIASYANAYLWDGKPKYQTNPMFGH